MCIVFCFLLARGSHHLLLACSLDPHAESNARFGSLGLRGIQKSSHLNRFLDSAISNTLRKHCENMTFYSRLCSQHVIPSISCVGWPIFLNNSPKVKALCPTYCKCFLVFPGNRHPGLWVARWKKYITLTHSRLLCITAIWGSPEER